jgi:hypothetical protein
MKTNTILILQNEIINVLTDTMQKKQLSESDMYLILQGVEAKISQMAMTRMAYNLNNNKKLEEGNNEEID